MEIETIILIIAVAFALVLLAMGLSVANFSGDRLFEVYTDTQKMANKKGMTGLDFALAVNHSKFNDKLKVTTVPGILTDHYQVGIKGVAISESNAKSGSIAGIAIVAHELGHAMQERTSSGRFKRFLFFLKIGSMIGFLMFPSLIAGIVLMLFGELVIYGMIALGIALGLFLLSLLIKFYTISMEKEASRIGMSFLEEALTSDEKKAAKKLLKTAILTYWGTFFQVLLSWTFLTKKVKYF